jgi:branched-chain amino acid transport system permease protein
MITAILINGIVSGGIIAVLTLGFSLVFGVAKILNMAHTAFYMITAFFIFLGAKKLGFSVFISSAIATLITIAIGMLCYKLLLDRIKERETAVLIITVALAMLFQEILLIIFGGTPLRVPPFVDKGITIANVTVTYQEIIAILATGAIMIAVRVLLVKTRWGNAIRAVAEDKEIANLMGINVDSICLVTMGISAGLAAVAGAVIAPISMVYPLMWQNPLVVVLAAVVLGGLGSLKGSIIAAFILAFAEAIVVFLVPGGSFLKGAVSLSVMVIVLQVRPEGLFGVLFEEERL